MSGQDFYVNPDDLECALRPPPEDIGYVLKQGDGKIVSVQVNIYAKYAVSIILFAKKFFQSRVCENVLLSKSTKVKTITHIQKII